MIGIALLAASGVRFPSGYSGATFTQRSDSSADERHQPTFLVQINFAKRKVELGTCGRAYGTRCQHEHACVRCPMLRPDPAQQHRLVEIIANLHERLAEARERGWFGEIEGLEASMVGAGQKLATMRRTPHTVAAPIALGLPTMPNHRADELSEHAVSEPRVTLGL
jgi:hypothetical protein